MWEMVTTTDLTNSNTNIEFGNFSRFYITASATMQMGSEVTAYSTTMGRNGGRLMLRNSYQDSMTDYVTVLATGGTFKFYGGSFDHIFSGYDTSKICGQKT